MFRQSSSMGSENNIWPDNWMSCLWIKTKVISIEAAKPSTLAPLTCFQGCVWYSVTSDCVGILLDANTGEKTCLFCFSGVFIPDMAFPVLWRSFETTGNPVQLCPGSAQRRNNAWAALHRQGYAVFLCPAREGEESFSTSFREKGVVGHGKASAGLSSRCWSLTGQHWTIQWELSWPNGRL